MSIPSLNEYGHLPEGVFECEEAEIVARYCHNNRNRSDIWTLFKEFMASDKPFSLPVDVYIDGGFVSDKECTKDIDVVIDISNLSDSQSLVVINWLTLKRNKFLEKYKVDCWVKHPFMQRDMVNYFQYIKAEEALNKGLSTDAKKGLLKTKIS